MPEIGKTYEEINIGDNASFSKTVTETDIIIYAGLTGDFNPLHVNSEFAKTSIFGERVAHGTIALGLIAPVVGMKLPGLGSILLHMEAKFIAPVKINDTITAEAKVIEKIEKNKSVKLATRFYNQRGEDVVQGSVTMLPPKRT
jgi:3-hydroxybutyryl-CoA dehydratase